MGILTFFRKWKDFDFFRSLARLVLPADDRARVPGGPAEAEWRHATSGQGKARAAHAQERLVTSHHFRLKKQTRGGAVSSSSLCFKCFYSILSSRLSRYWDGTSCTNWILLRSKCLEKAPTHFWLNYPLQFCVVSSLFIRYVGRPASKDYLEHDWRHLLFNRSNGFLLGRM